MRESLNECTSETHTTNLSPPTTSPPPDPRTPVPARTLSCAASFPLSPTSVLLITSPANTSSNRSVDADEISFVAAAVLKSTVSAYAASQGPATEVSENCGRGKGVRG